MVKLQALGAAAPSAEVAAKAIYEELRLICAAHGEDPDFEVLLKQPGDDQRAWQVFWESGPSMWAVGLFVMGPWGFCETDYGCDLIFNEEEM